MAEAERLLAATEEAWHPMVLTALRTGLRQGEFCALRWEDLDLVEGVVNVRRATWKGVVSSPKSNRFRTVPMSSQLVDALRAHRHLRGELVFCRADGAMLTYNEVKHPLWRACRREGLRSVQWHVLRHYADIGISGTRSPRTWRWRGCR